MPGYLKLQVLGHLSVFSALFSFLKKLTDFGITPKVLKEGKALVAAFEEVQRTQTQKKGEVQRNTRQRNEARRKLQKWVKGFKNITQLALQEDEELLETLGIIVPNH